MSYVLNKVAFVIVFFSSLLFSKNELRLYVSLHLK